MDKATELQNELKQMVKNREISLRVLSSGATPKEQTVISYNPDSKKFFLIAGSIGKVQWNDGKVSEQISPRHAKELIRGKNSIIISDPNPLNPDKEIVIEVH